MLLRQGKAPHATSSAHSPDASLQWESPLEWLRYFRTNSNQEPTMQYCQLQAHAMMAVDLASSEVGSPEHYCICQCHWGMTDQKSTGHVLLVVKQLSTACIPGCPVCAFQWWHLLLKERSESIGAVVGYSVRLESRTSRRTRLLFCTTGEAISAYLLMVWLLLDHHCCLMLKCIDIRHCIYCCMSSFALLL